MNRRGGFTLVEVLVALVVTVAALTILAQGFTAGARASTVSQNATRAALLARQVLTDLELGELSIDQSHSDVFLDDLDFRYEVMSEPGDPGIVILTIRVVWMEGRIERDYVLVRMMRERPQPR